MSAMPASDDSSNLERDLSRFMALFLWPQRHGNGGFRASRGTHGRFEFERQRRNRGRRIDPGINTSRWSCDRGTGRRGRH